MKIIIITFLLYVIAACSNQFTYTSTYFDYSGKDGCTPANIGTGSAVIYLDMQAIPLKVCAPSKVSRVLYVSKIGNLM